MINSGTDRAEIHNVQRSFYKYCILICLVALGVRPGVAHSDSPVSESAVKAAIIYKIAKFVTWPDSAFDAGDESLSVCMMANSPMAEAMSTLQGRSVRGRPIVIRKFGRLEDIKTGCHILYVHEDKTAPAQVALSRVAHTPVLTVGDGEVFVERGGIIALSIEDNRVQFAINLTASEEVGLEISAQLLQVARIVSSTRSSGQGQP